jgi:hypothetical protein
MVNVAPWWANKASSARVHAVSVSSRRPSLSKTTAWGGEARVTSGTLRDRSARLAPEEPDPRALGQPDLVDDREAVTTVEREVGLFAGLQIGGQVLAVAEVEPGTDQL